MALIGIEGVYMQSYIKTTNFDGKEKSTVRIDIYQSQSPLDNKMITVASDNISLSNELQKNYAQGTAIKLDCTVGAYQNRNYFKLVELKK